MSFSKRYWVYCDSCCESAISFPAWPSLGGVWKLPMVDLNTRCLKVVEVKANDENELRSLVTQMRDSEMIVSWFDDAHLLHPPVKCPVCDQQISHVADSLPINWPVQEVAAVDELSAREGLESMKRRQGSKSDVKPGT